MDKCGGSEVKEIMAYRYKVYDILRRVYLWELPQEVFEELCGCKKTGETGNDNTYSPEDLFFDYLSSLPLDDLEQIYRDIRIEYTRLFVGPYHLPTPPYESVYRSATRLVMQNETITVKKFYTDNCFQVISKEPLDHIGIELEFMYAMSAKTIKALQDEDNQLFENLIAIQKEFCNLHLLKWLASFTNDIIENTRIDFWNYVALFTLDFIQKDVFNLGELENRNLVSV